MVTISTVNGDSVITFLSNKHDTLKFYRCIDIVENLNDDTLLLGYAIVPSKFLGKITFIQDGLDSTQATYIDNSKYLDHNDTMFYAKLFSLQVFKNKKLPIKKLRIKVKIINRNCQL